MHNTMHIQAYIRLCMSAWMCILVIMHHAHICMSIGYCMSTLCRIHTRMNIYFLKPNSGYDYMHIWVLSGFISGLLGNTGKNGFSTPPPRLMACDLPMLKFTITPCVLYEGWKLYPMGEGWWMFPKWWTGLDHHLVIGPLFWKCFTPWALTPHLYSMQDLLSFPPSQSVLVFDKGAAACCISSLIEQDFNP
jgi:hypothetical protein